MNPGPAFIGSAGGPELLIIFAVVLLVFGPRQLPRIARMIGKALEELRSVSDDFRSEIMSIDVEPLEYEDVAEAGDEEEGDAEEEDGEKTDDLAG